MFGLSFFSLASPAFIAGLITFLAPCTLPLVPGYLVFISGVSLSDLKKQNLNFKNRRAIFLNGLFFVLGFTFAFVGLGLAAGAIGHGLGRYQFYLARVGGVFVIIFGLLMLDLIKIPFLNQEKKIKIPQIFQRGNGLNSLILGAAFGFGWTPCIGPILGSVLLLASTSTTIVQGGGLLLIFSLGLAIPFLLLALGISQATLLLKKITPVLKIFSLVGGVFLILLGFLMLTNQLGIWTGYFYHFLNFSNYQRIYDFL
ncbi:MAG: sulfite exporter TauE/SafE family protein [Candidatus Buchananbacteria bacterium]|nr:sulfite exporter TauE/SafE family protein [Candidatus Buchananbacteria bacterium]